MFGLDLQVHYWLLFQAVLLLGMIGGAAGAFGWILWQERRHEISLLQWIETFEKPAEEAVEPAFRRAVPPRVPIGDEEDLELTWDDRRA